MIKTLIFSLFIHAATAAIHPFYIGTGNSADSKGIYLADFDDSNGVLSNLRLAAAYKNPGFLCIHPTKKLLYSTGLRADGTGALATFAIEKNQLLTFIGDTSCAGENPCHLAIDPSSSMIAIANYGNGIVSSFLLDKKGIPSEAVCVIKHQGTSVHPTRQKGPHAHGVYFSDQTLFVPDLGLDQILAYTFDVNSAVIKPAAPAFTASTPGDGPRHLAFHASKPWVYVVNELTNTVTHFTRAGNKLTMQKSITTLPSDWQGENTTAEIEIHSNGRYLYASNRGHNSIAAFSINQENGELTALGQTVTAIKTPRHFAIAPGGAYLIVAGQQSNNLQVLSIDAQSGKLNLTSNQLEVPAPICLLFLK
jgi:6-phosphogluconolactonase